MDCYEKMRELGIELPPPPGKGGIYSSVRKFGDRFYYTSGVGCKKDGKPLFTGQAGKDFTVKQGQEAARVCVLNLLSNIEAELHDLNRIKRFIKILGFVSSADDFGQQPKVIDGASRMLIDIFGEEAGCAARSAIGVNNLPGNQAVEIELLFETEAE